MFLKVYEQSISAVCQIEWPKHRMLIQVLDDSSDEETQELIHAEVCKWQSKGVNIIYRHRENRTGYKAGNLKSAMACEYVKNYEFVTIFDADFQPKPDFLKRTMPHFKVQVLPPPPSSGNVKNAFMLTTHSKLCIASS